MKKIIALSLFGIALSSLAFADYRKAAEQVQIGDYSAALEALQDTLETDPKSQYLMAFMYYHGMGVEKSYRQAAELFERAMKGGNTESITFLAYMYDEGKGVRMDRKKAFDLYQQASEAGDATATMNLAVMYYRGNGIPQNYTKAFSLMNSIENVRDPIVQFYLGNFYFYGFGTEKNLEKAVPYYIRSAQLGLPEAHYMLGYIYQNGFGTKADINKAIKYYEYAAYKKQPQAQFNLASLYADGKTGKVDKPTAYAWLSLAVDNELEAAKDALAKLSDAMTISEVSQAKQTLSELNKKILSGQGISSEALNEDLGDRSFKLVQKEPLGPTKMDLTYSQQHRVTRTRPQAVTPKTTTRPTINRNANKVPLNMTRRRTVRRR